MRALLTFAILGILASSSISGARAQGKAVLSLDTYLCGKFITDAAHPNSAEKLLRTMMMVSWAAGFAAAHEKGNYPRADKAGLEITGAALRTICTEKPLEPVTQAFVQSVDKFLKIK